ncbi:MAG: phosphate/phosphite/phosphonate ABC transporter substrate-binding protein [Deltaproteobacteria bacterium]|nr:phosphate/phosphite/phosphonate ABC transporter substrate-binding protein [Deltaproteobacteria bacterium]
MFLRRPIIWAGMSAVILCFLSVVSYGDTSQKHVSIAILPCSDVVMTFKKFHPLVQYLKQQTGLEIDLIVPKDSEAFEWAIKNREMDFVFQDPHTYVKFAELYNKDTLIRSVTTSGEVYQSGLIIARKDSGITDIRQLRGKTFMFGPKLSAVKWIAAAKLFKENGLDIDKDLKAYQNSGCCEDIAFTVFLKAVDAGVVCEHFIEGHPEKQKELGININDIAIIGKTGAVPTKMFAALKGVDHNLVSRVNRALLRLDKNNPTQAAILYSAEIGGFQTAKDKDYDRMRTDLGMRR